MQIKGRRRLDMVLLGAGVVVAGGVTAFGSVVGNTERIERIWAGAQLRDDGSAAVTEVIDYNFGSTPDRHGIYRIIPGLSSQSPVTVQSPDAPAGIAAITDEFAGTEPAVRIKIGDPAITVSGRHRYRLDYLHPGLMDGDALAWDAVGTGWDHTVVASDVNVVAPWEFTDVKCFVGAAGSTKRCDIEQPEPGRLVAHVGSLDAKHGITVSAGHGRTLESGAPALPAPPAAPPDDPGAGVALPSAVGAVGALGASASMSRYVRRRGRERVGTGGAADAAFAAAGGSTSEVLLDASELAQMATTEFAPPDGLTAPMGGMLLAERVTPNQKTAWLIEAAIQGAIDLDESDGVRLVRKTDGLPEAQPILDSMFGGRSEITLGSYDSVFAKGWAKIDGLLEGWIKGSGLWDPAGDKRKTMARIFGVLGCILGLVVVGVGGAVSGRFGEGWLAVVIAGGIVAGAGFAAVLRSWELKIRSVQGSAQWLRVESFRRFLHGSEAFHAEEAAKRGLLREYTAWAVAVGEIDRWEKAVKHASLAPDTAGLGYVFLAPHLASAASHAATAPSSSGGGGGSVGGGGGGGGGGSW